jgi:hypothetical protein
MPYQHITDWHPLRLYGHIIFLADIRFRTVLVLTNHLHAHLRLWQTLLPRTSYSGLVHRPGLWCRWSFSTLMEEAGGCWRAWSAAKIPGKRRSLAVNRESADATSRNASNSVETRGVAYRTVEIILNSDNCNIPEHWRALILCNQPVCCSYVL